MNKKPYLRPLTEKKKDKTKIIYYVIGSFAIYALFMIAIILSLV